MNTPNKLSMSIMFENRIISNEISIPTTTPSIWIPSKNISKCYKCKDSFSIWKENIIVEYVVEFSVHIVQMNGILYRV